MARPGAVGSGCSPDLVSASRRIDRHGWVLAKHDVHGQERNREDRRSEVCGPPFGKGDPDHPGADQVHGDQGQREPEAASGEPELAPQPASSKREDRQAEDDQQGEPDQESSHRRQ